MVTSFSKRTAYSTSMKELLGYVARHRGELEETLTEKPKELLDKMMQEYRVRLQEYDIYLYTYGKGKEDIHKKKGNGGAQLR